MKHFISLEKAKTMTALYRREKDNVVANEHRGKGTLSLSETFDAECFRAVLSKPECTGIRIYYGMDDLLKVHAIVVGVNSNNEDILPLMQNTASTIDTTITVSTDDDDTGIIEEGISCPPGCPPPSALN